MLCKRCGYGQVLDGVCIQCGAEHTKGTFFIPPELIKPHSIEEHKLFIGKDR